MTTPRRSPTRPLRRADRGAETQQAVRRAALELFAEHGFDATTTSAIAERAGVATGTLFIHATDKADLLFLVMHDRLERAAELGLAEVPEGDLVHRLMHVFRPVFASYGEHPLLARDFIRRLPGAEGTHARRMATLTFGFLHRLALLVREAQARGEVAPGVDVHVAARNCFAVYFASLMGWLDGHCTLEHAYERLLRESLNQLFEGLRAR